VKRHSNGIFGRFLWFTFNVKLCNFPFYGGLIQRLEKPKKMPIRCNHCETEKVEGKAVSRKKNMFYFCKSTHCKATAIEKLRKSNEQDPNHNDQLQRQYAFRLEEDGFISGGNPF